MRLVHFTVPGEPHGKARARTVRDRRGHVHSYTPESTVLYENLVKVSYAQAATLHFSKEEELEVTITAFFGVPKSASKKIRHDMLLGKIRPTKKPDIDNIVKSILDALNGVAYHDDAQVVSLRTEKRYSEEPRVEVEIRNRGEVL